MDTPTTEIARFPDRKNALPPAARPATGPITDLHLGKAGLGFTANATQFTEHSLTQPYVNLAITDIVLFACIPQYH